MSRSGIVDIAQALSTNFSLTNTGTAVLIMSQIVQVYQADCTAASLKTCPNLNQPVLINRIVLGNSSLRSSSYGTPPASYLDSSGNITSSNYLQQSSLIAGGFGAVMTLAISSGAMSSAGPKPRTLP